MDLGKIFDSGNNINNILLRINEAVDDVSQLVSAGAFEVGSLDVTAPQPNLTIFKTPVKLSATAKLAARIAAQGEKFQPFRDGIDVTAPDGQSYAQLKLEAKLEASANGGGNVGSLAISAEASSTAGLSYEHLLPVDGAQTRLRALTDLALTTELPQLADIRGLRPGEVLSFDAMFNLDLGIKAKYGATLGIDEAVSVGSDLSLPVKAHLEFTAGAALGIGVYEEVSVIVARAGQRNDGWVRIRLTRKHRNRITFGASFNLGVQYDLSQGPQMLLDKAFAQLQMPKLVTDLQEILALAQTPWPELVNQLSAKAADAVLKLGGDGWQQWLADSQQVQQFLTASNWIVNTYDKIEEKVKSVWEELLARLNETAFGRARTLIHQLATLDVNTIDLQALAGGQFDELIEWIELFSGKDIEELVLIGEIRTELEKAIAFAGKVDGMLDNAVQNHALEALRGFAKRTGIEAVVTWLRQNGTTVQGLQSAAESWVRSSIERLTGKLLSQVDQSDVQRLQAFAAKAQQLLNAPSAIKAKLGNAVAKLKGEFTVSLAVEISRVSESSALVDIEINPANNASVDAALRFLPSGDVQHLLSSLGEINTDEEQAPYDIRELVLTSRHIRTSTATLFFSFLGAAKSEKSQIRESTIRVEGGGNQQTQRTALYSGGVVVRRSVSGADSEGGAWLRVEATAPNLDIKASYQSFDPSFRLTYVREDVKTTAEELQSISTILGDVGFLTGGQSFDTATPVGLSTRFALELSFPAAAVTAIVRDIDNQTQFDLDLRNAAARWFNDTAVSPQGIRQTGQDMAAVLRSPAFAAASGDPEAFRNAAMQGLLPGSLWDSVRHVIKPQYTPLVSFVASRSDPWHRRYVRFRPQDIPAQPMPAQLAGFTKQGVMMFSTASVEWQLPLFNFWLVLARLSRIDPQMLTRAKGVATFRTRQTENDAWTAPQWFVLPDGVGIQAAILRNRFRITA